MDIAAKVAKLEQAQGDPRKLTLAAIDIFLSSREPWLREALEAAAIPHWFTEEILGKLLLVDQATSEQYLAALKGLPFIERFELRNGWNVHEATRLALRSEWADAELARFQELSTHAAELFEGDEPQQQVEQTYHLLTSNPVEAEKVLYDLWKKWDDAGRIEPLQALAIALSELLQNATLQPVARARALLCLGLIQRDRFPIAVIEKLARECLELFTIIEDRQAEVDTRDLLGDILLSQGRREEALREYQESKRIRLDLTKRDPGNTGWLRDLSTSHNKVGGILEAEGRREEALREYQEYMRIMLDLTKRDPGNTGWMRELSVSHNNVGGILEAEGRREEALLEYQESKRIMLDLTRRDPGKTVWLRDHSVTYNKVGGILETEGRREEALREFQEYRRIMLDLTKRDLGNTGWLRELSVSHNNVGGILEAEGWRDEALLEYQESKRIMLDLTRRDPGNTGWLLDLSISHNKVGSLLAEAFETLAEALTEHQQSLTLAKRLAQIDPGNRQWTDLLDTCCEWVSKVQRLLDERTQQTSVSA